MSTRLPPVSSEWLAQVEEPILDPERVIVDPHHHLWCDARGDYLLDQLWADTGSGHKVVKTIFVECRSQYLDQGPAHLRPTGETAFVNAIAANSRQGPGPAISGIVAFGDLTSGSLLCETLDRHAEIAGPLLVGIRHHAAFPEHPESLTIPGRAARGLMADEAFREGARQLGQRGLPLDCWHYHYQNREFLALARALPDTLFVLDHFGTPLGVGPYAAERDTIFDRWKRDIAEIACCDNVVAKLGGLAMPDNGFGWHQASRPPTSEEIAAAQREYYLHTIDCFGPARCLFESNFPVDKRSLSYAVLYNAFKKMVADFSESEKDALFSRNAERVYGLR